MDLAVDVDATTGVATVEVQRPPNNFFDLRLLRDLADTFDRLDEDPGARAIVLCSEGKHFCAGRDFSRDRAEGDTPERMYGQAARLVAARTPWIAAVQGAAVGGGLGLAMAADFRVATPRARFSANFAMLGFHHGFGLGVTLPRVVGMQRAAELLYTGRRVDGAGAAAIGLVDLLVEADDLRRAALAFAAEIAGAAPLAVQSIRDTLRGDLAARFREATRHEAAEQDRLRQTADFREGITAAAERRRPVFERR